MDGDETVETSSDGIVHTSDRDLDAAGDDKDEMDEMDEKQPRTGRRRSCSSTPATARASRRPPSGSWAGRWARGWTVGVVQFVKSGKWKVGERKLAEHLGIEWSTMGDGFTWESTDLDETAAKARHAWEVARAKLASGDYDMLILDEITYAITYGWVGVDDVVAGITGRAPKTNVVITGRDAAPELDRDRRHRHRDAQGQARL